MAGVDLLLEYLLDEISILGDSGKVICCHFVTLPTSQPCMRISTDIYPGATSADFLGLVSKFYEQEAGTVSAQIDRPLLDTVWNWLTDRPEVSVGKEREGNALSLSEFEAAELQHAGPDADLDAGATADEDQPTETKSSGPLRIFTSIIRRWQTMTGHAPDVTLVPPAEFQALCLITAAGERGIIQTQLSRLSGQDKRSLPHRTDNLARHGYIEKRPYYIKNVKTSLLRHRKFCRAGEENQLTGKHIFTPDGFDFDYFMKLLAHTLQSEGPITLVNLHQRLAVAGGSSWQFRCVRRGLDKLEVIGIITRFRARRDIRTISQALYVRCVKLERMPSEEDRKAVHAVSRVQLDEFRLRLQRESDESKQLSDQNDDQIPDAQLDPQLEIQEDADEVPDVGVVEQAARKFAPIFLDPDDPFPNAIFRTVQRAGVKGISTTVGHHLPRNLR
jgi:transcription factor C subunit 3